MAKEYTLSDGVTFEEYSGPIYEKFNKDIGSFEEGFVRILPYDQMLPRCFLKYQKKIKDFEVRSDDVWVCSFPKCGNGFFFTFWLNRYQFFIPITKIDLGTTWTQEMVWCIMNNYDYEKAANTTLDERIPYFE